MLLLAAVAGAGYWVWARTQPVNDAVTPAAIKTATVTNGVVTRHVRVTGQTSARKYANITAPLLRGPEGGRALVLLFLAKSGGMVKKGDQLVEIDGQSMADHLEDVKDTVEAAASDVKKRRAEQAIDMENLQQTLRVAKAEWDKAKLDASAAEVRTEIERQLLQLAEEEARARYNQLQADVKFKETAQRAEIRILELTEERHKRHRDRHAVDLTRYTIHSPMDGLVVLQSIYRGGGESQQIAQGDQVFPGQPILKVVDPNSMQMEATVNQAESGEFRLSQAAVVGLDAFPGLTFKGKVFSIGALAVGGWRQNYYIRNVPVKLDIEGADPRLIPDLSSSADVEIESSQPGPVVPLAALETEGGKHFVHIKSGNGFERREVSLGLRNQTVAAVASGLRAGEEVRVN